MGRPATLVIRIVSDASRAASGFDQTASRLDKFQSKVNAASKVAAGMVAAIGAVGAAAFKSASELEQASGAVESVFGRQAAAVKSLAADAAQSVGLATSEYSQLAAVLGAQLGNLGVAEDQLVGTTDDLITRAADLAATFGGTTSEAVSALSALMRGESDPIERYGVSIKQADVNARLAEQGLGKLTGAAKTQAETQAKLALLTEQTAAAQGAFGREANTAAGQQQRLAAEFENTKAALGQALLPLVTSLAQELSGVARWASENTGLVQTLAAAALGLSAAIFVVNLALRAYAAASAVVAGTRLAWAAVAASAQSGAIATGLLWTRILVMYVAQTVASTARAAALWVASMARTAASFAIATAAMVAQRAAMVAGAVAAGALTAAQWLLNAAMSANPIGIIIIAIVALVAAIVLAYQKSETFRAIVQAVMSAAAAAVGWVIDKVSEVYNWIKGKLISVVTSVATFFADAFNTAKGVIDTVAGAISTVVGWIQTLINWISNISWPSPPGWLSSLFGGAMGPDLIGVPRPDQVFRFFPPDAIYGSAAMPSLTAGHNDNELATLARIGSSNTTVQQTNISVTIDGALDPLAVGAQIERVLKRFGRGPGGSQTFHAGGGY